jgi:NAD(P)-dependent dehydrogenase (short-subunit alcohol dehydrogenase family)
MRLAERKVLVTGAASGIGRAIAEAFAAQGAALLLGDIDTDGLAESCAAKGGPGTIARAACDVTDAEAVRRMVATARTQLGGLDGVVNCAGIDLERGFLETSPADWERVLAVNLSGTMLVCRAALPLLIEGGGGTIVNIASGAGLRPLQNRTAYCSAKAGLIMLGRALALEFADRRVRVNTICPGAVDTPMFRQGLAAQGGGEAALAEITERYAMARLGTPDEIANAALFLTSAESSFVTGAALAADGGRTFH